MARLPGRPHQHRARDGHPGRGHGPDPREDVREPPVLRRQARHHGRSGDRSAIRIVRSSAARAVFTASAWRAPTSGPAWRCSSRRCAPRATSEIGNIRQIDRGYERIDERLRLLGARIERVAHGARAGLAPRRRRMTHPIPPGTRDVLPDEMRELRAHRRPHARAPSRAPATARSARRRSSTRRCCAAATSAPPAPATGRFDEHGRRAGAALRHDDPDRARGGHPLRRRRAAAAVLATWRTPTEPSTAAAGEPREFLQAGIELIGVPGAEGEAEVVALTIEALDAAGLRRHRVGVGDGALYRAPARARSACPDEAHLPMLEALSRRDLVGLEAQVRALGLADAERDAARPAARAARRPGGARARRGAAGESRRGARGPARAARAAGRARRRPTG